MEPVECSWRRFAGRRNSARENDLSPSLTDVQTARTVFQIHGMEPGPLIFIASSDLVWITILAMFLANLLIVLLGWLQTRLVTMLQHMRSANGG